MDASDAKINVLVFEVPQDSLLFLLDGEFLCFESE